MIDKQRLLIKALTSAQEQVGADAVPPATANDVIDVLGLGGKSSSDLIDKAQHDGLLARRWGGFLALSHSGREVARGPGAEADDDGRIEMAVAELVTATVFLRRMPLTPQVALEARNLFDETRATVVSLTRHDDEAEDAPTAHLERINKLATRISQSRHADVNLLSATARLAEACAETARAIAV
jgi:hypothetical protein